MSAIEVRKYDWQGQFRYAWAGEIVQRTPDHIVIDAVWNGPGSPTVGAIAFEPGDRFIEHYYPGKSYAIWQIEEPTGAIKGWYCNISTPVEETAEGLAFNDLLLDVLVYPDGRFVILDRDEFAAACKEGLAGEQVMLAEMALGELLALIQDGAAPFAFASSATRASKR